MKPKYTKAERHVIYKKAKELIIKEVVYGCIALKKAANPNETIPTILLKFPEFFKFKPKNAAIYTPWFDTKKERLAAFDKCIKLTATKKLKK